MYLMAGIFGNHSTTQLACISTASPSQNVACKTLTDGFHLYCPMMIKRVKHARRVQDALRPLFPGYILPNCGLARRRGVHCSDCGVDTPGPNGDEPGFLNGSFIDGLKARELDGVIRRPSMAFEVGQKVAVQGGPFDGLVGEIIRFA